MGKIVVTYTGSAQATDDIAKATRHLKRDPVLKPIIERIGPCQLKPRKEYFFVLCDSIISQQLSVKVSEILLERFRKHCAKIGKHPRPEEVLGADADELRKLGLSYQKISYLKDLAQHFVDGKITPRKFSKLCDEEIIAELVAVKGIGRWTAEMFLIFSLCRLDIWPVDDLGIKKAVQKNYALGAMPTAKELIAFAQDKPWRPYRSVVSWYLWRTL
jgi:DNA-3-methyladenine glycosylase II